MIEYQIAFGAGVALVGALGVAALGAQVGQWGYKYIDDGEALGDNKLLKLFKNKRETHPYKGYLGYYYKTPDRTSKVYGEGTHRGGDYKFSRETNYNLLFAVVALLLGPLGLLLAYKLWALVLPVVTVYAVMRLARFSVRLSKKFKLHKDDPEAHKV